MSAKKPRRYIVVPRTVKAQQAGLQTSKGRIGFNGKSSIYVDDAALASEIDTHQGEHGSNDVWVCQDEKLEWHERQDGNTDGNNVTVHHYTFGASRRYSDAWDEFEKRRKDKKGETK